MPRSTLDISPVESSPSPGSSLDGGELTPVAPSQLHRRTKRRLDVDESSAKRSAMYDAAIRFMQQPPPPAPKPKDEEELFGEYVAGQLRLVADPRAKLLIKARINNLFLMQQMEQVQPTTPSQVNNQPFIPQELTNSSLLF